MTRPPEPPEQSARPAAKNEFSFTLYDLDGRGRVTQDVSILENVCRCRIVQLHRSIDMLCRFITQFMYH